MAVIPAPTSHKLLQAVEGLKTMVIRDHYLQIIFVTPDVVDAKFNRFLINNFLINSAS